VRRENITKKKCGDRSLTTLNRCELDPALFFTLDVEVLRVSHFVFERIVLDHGVGL
jgi:hypothetical protein